MGLWSRNVILKVVPLCVLLAGCFHRAPVPAAAPAAAPPSTIHTPETADKRFETGQYLDAAQAYEAYLKENPDYPDIDRITFRLALSYALAGNEPENFRRSLNLLRTLFTQFPESQYKPATQYILSLHADIDRLRMDLRSKDDRVQDLNESLKEKDKVLGEKDKLIQDKEKALLYKDRILREKERILGEREKALAEMEDKTFKLSQELDRMKKIDLQRRPSRPPD